MLIGMHLTHDLETTKIVLCGNIQLESAVDFLACETSGMLLDEEIINLTGFVVTVLIIGRVIAEQLELEGLDVLGTVSVVADDADHGLLAKVKLVLRVHDLRSRFRAAAAQEVANLSRGINPDVDLRSLNARSVDIDRSGASEA